jgi:hypothetical protein
MMEESLHYNHEIQEENPYDMTVSQTLGPQKVSFVEITFRVKYKQLFRTKDQSIYFRNKLQELIKEVSERE